MRRIVIFSLFVLVFSCRGNDENKSIDKPNIIIILTDDQGYADVGFNGCKDIPTPNIDRIANNGVRFTNAYVSYAVCGPSRAGLITGRYQDRFGFGRNPLFAPNDPDQGLPLSEETLATTLDNAGYQTMALGKWHLGAHESQRPLNRGFDEFFGFLTGGHKYFPDEWTLDNIAGVKSQFDAYKTKLLSNNNRVEETEYLTDALSREAVAFIERSADNPFFIYLAYNAPHVPLQATEKYLSRFDHIEDSKRKTYAAMVSSVDDGVGKIMDKLEELNLAENTIVFFLSDNGGPYKSNGSRNDPLREGKGSLYEGGIRVPFAMQWPAVIGENLVFDQPVISLDIFATVAKYANAKPRNPLDGINLIPFLLGEKEGPPHSHLFWRKYDSRSYAVRGGPLKLVNIDGEGDEMYNLEKDIGEHQELDTDENLQMIINSKLKWDSQMKDPIFLGLGQNDAYNELHPDRFNLEPY
jgi:arylsulfatase A-like enzyme